MSTTEAEPQAEEMPGAGMEIEAIRNQVATRELLTDSEIRRLWRVASSLAQSQMFPDAKEAAKAFAKILVGRDLGLTPTQAMMGIHLVEGKPMLHYAVLGGFVRAREGYDYRVREHDATKCEIEFLRHGETLGVSSYTIEDAKLAGLKFKDSKGKDTNWVKQPKVMLLARALSQGCRWYVPEVLGGIPVYAEDEIEASTKHVGDGGPAAGIDLGPKVEGVLARALRLRHMGLADRATAELALGDQPPKDVDDWVKFAHAELDKVDPDVEKPDSEPEEKGDAEPEVVDPDGVEAPGEGDKNA